MSSVNYESNPPENLMSCTNPHLFGLFQVDSWCNINPRDFIYSLQPLNMLFQVDSWCNIILGIFYTLCPLNMLFQVDSWCNINPRDFLYSLQPLNMLFIYPTNIGNDEL